METIIDYLKRKLIEATPARWEAISEAANVAKTLPRKLVYDSRRQNPTVQTVQPLYDYFKAVDSGKRKLPAANDAKQKAKAA